MHACSMPALAAKARLVFYDFGCVHVVWCLHMKLDTYCGLLLGMSRSDDCLTSRIRVLNKQAVMR